MQKAVDSAECKTWGSAAGLSVDLVTQVMGGIAGLLFTPPLGVGVRDEAEPVEVRREDLESSTGAPTRHLLV